ncbi:MULTISPECIES: FkbM family methyltransferase [unclassified Nostoc]|uniref:FkbM family methyltransferase n=1 Tax=unclassified Nostoc TaxID=2593658 RepID=UPI002AD2E9F5|nr:FkbM family methyltransferase [Nostoc sp. DedQUE03]MDZ7973520.1 FkbM family methyltransferase [Nostoc sp. DedQUE03]MDZ8047241.1 FkbM family methyltransferase [Nostoc sp. DedQUE02]
MIYTNFSLTLFKEILVNLTNNYNDNLNTYTSVHHEDVDSWRKKTAKLIKNFGLRKSVQYHKYSNLLRNIKFYFLDIFNLYELLEDKISKDLLIKIIAYRILGHKKYKLPLNNEQYWEQFRKLEQATNSKSYINIDYRDWKLSQFEIVNNGHNITLYYVPIGILDTFIVKQYECPVQKQLKAKEGNIVIDAGGCWGDTALYFASEVGDAGKVYTFEFIPSNVSIMKKNIEINSTLQKRIEIIERPLWNESEKVMYYSDNGPASFVSFEEMQNDIGEKVLTISIDDFVKKNNIERIDFIKMDIEGAELNSLKGAINVINTFRPNLAISIYHSLDDFVKIPEFIHSLHLGYKFYLGHFTIHSEETVLYAISDA